MAADTHRFHIPSRIVTGVGASECVGIEAKRLGAKRVLLVTDEGIMQEGYVDQVRERIASEGIEVEVFDGVTPDPTVKNVEDALALFKGGGCDMVVSLGGGSSIDAGKATSVMAANPGSIRDYVGIEKIPNPGVPLIALPTTCGTGSEVSMSDIITDTERNVKMLIISFYVLPRVALVDPRFTLTLSREMTANTAVDALTHAIEAYVSVKAQPITDTLALRAIELISANLGQAWADETNLEARGNTMLGAHLAGMAFSNSSVALVHGMSRPIGAYFHVPHGLSNAVLLERVMHFSLVGSPARYAGIARAMGVNVHGLPSMEAAEKAVEAVRRLCTQVQIPTLSEIGIIEEKLRPNVEQMARDALASGSPANNPRKATVEEIVQLYIDCL